MALFHSKPFCYYKNTKKKKTANQNLCDFLLESISDKEEIRGKHEHKKKKTFKVIAG